MGTSFKLLSHKYQVSHKYISKWQTRELTNVQKYSHYDTCKYIQQVESVHIPV